MVAPVEGVGDTAGASPQKATFGNDHDAPTQKINAAPVGAVNSRRWIVSFVVAAAMIVATLVAAKSPWSRASVLTQAPAAHSRVMLAVLPFENLTGDTAQDYFS